LLKESNGTQTVWAERRVPNFTAGGTYNYHWDFQVEVKVAEGTD